MSVKRIDIEIPKMDYQIINLTIKNENETSKLEEKDEIYMTVKRHANNEEIKFQKKLGNGITYNEETGKYEIEINSEDTKQLAMDIQYGYDITIYYGGNKPKQKVIGTIKIGKKYTLKEVD